MTLDGQIRLLVLLPLIVYRFCSAPPRCLSPLFCRRIYGLFMYNVTAFIMPFRFFFGEFTIGLTQSLFYSYLHRISHTTARTNRHHYVPSMPLSMD